MKDERERFEEWWAVTMGASMKGSKYLARNAWLAALWAYEVNTKPIESSGEKDKLRGSSNVGIERKPDGPGSSPGPRLPAPLPEVEEAMRVLSAEGDALFPCPFKEQYKAALAVIRAALKPKVARRKWLSDRFIPHRYGLDSYVIDAIVGILRELGIEVEP